MLTYIYLIKPSLSIYVNIYIINIGELLCLLERGYSVEYRGCCYIIIILCKLHMIHSTGYTQRASLFIK